MSRESHKSIERAKKIASMSFEEQCQYLESEKAANRQSGATLCSKDVLSTATQRVNLQDMIAEPPVANR